MGTLQVLDVSGNEGTSAKVNKRIWEERQDEVKSEQDENIIGIGVRKIVKKKELHPEVCKNPLQYLMFLKRNQKNESLWMRHWQAKKIMYIQIRIFITYGISVYVDDNQYDSSNEELLSSAVFTQHSYNPIGQWPNYCPRLFIIYLCAR